MDSSKEKESDFLAGRDLDDAINALPNGKTTNDNDNNDRCARNLGNLGLAGQQSADENAAGAAAWL